MKLNKYFIYLVIFALCFLAVTFLADKGLIPTKLKIIPYYDSIGHFILFGIYALLAQLAFGVRYLGLPMGSALVAIYAVCDEFLQKLSPNRSFDYHDLFFSLLGIVVFSFELYRRKLVSTN